MVSTTTSAVRAIFNFISQGKTQRKQSTRSNFRGSIPQLWCSLPTRRASLTADDASLASGCLAPDSTARGSYPLGCFIRFPCSNSHSTVRLTSPPSGLYARDGTKWFGYNESSELCSSPTEGWELSESACAAVAGAADAVVMRKFITRLRIYCTLHSQTGSRRSELTFHRLRKDSKRHVWHRLPPSPLFALALCRSYQRSGAE